MDSFNDVMDAVKAYCKGRVSDASYRVFIQDLNLLNFEGTNIIILEVPNDVVMRFAAARYADHFGYAFQIRDDMLDVIGDEKTFGKPIGSDREEGKTTFVDILGLDGCQRLVREHSEQAAEALSGLDGADFLVHLVRVLEERDK